MLLKVAQKKPAISLVRLSVAAAELLGSIESQEISFGLGFFFDFLLHLHFDSSINLDNISEYADVVEMGIGVKDLDRSRTLDILDGILFLCVSLDSTVMKSCVFKNGFG